MNKLLAYFFLLGYLIQPLQVVNTYISFKVNQEYIAKVLCINKDKPDLKCNGQCHLKKEISKTTPKEDKTPQTIRMNELIQIAEKTINLEQNLYSKIVNNYRPYKNPFNNIKTESNIFHPPKLVTFHINLS